MVYHWLLITSMQDLHRLKDTHIHYLFKMLFFFSLHDQLLIWNLFELSIIVWTAACLFNVASWSSFQTITITRIVLACSYSRVVAFAIAIAAATDLSVTMYYGLSVDNPKIASRPSALWNMSEWSWFEYGIVWNVCTGGIGVPKYSCNPL